MSVADLPPINATLNGITTVLLCFGWWFIKHDRKPQHIACMVSALVTSTVFLACYLTYHILVEHLTKFTYLGWPRYLYFTILISHTFLAIVALPMIICTVIPALRARYDKHRRLARWTLPVWLYVSFTGVIVYFMLYRWFPPVLVQS